ncbi:MAG: hypothetical protein ACK56I_27500 [bacterium]
MRPRGAPRKLRRAGQRRRNSVGQHTRRVRLADDGCPVHVRQDWIAAHGGRTASLTTSANCARHRTGIALLNK